ncbi:VPLPA-CTERM sorting domain-containing protein [Roseovarius sp.]|uniref:VPLPA-CTERM sorting domain-containing protein n=1 Tax=Roseovarius sp. TaxID=1486281 RepID=UPI003D100E69
MVNLVLGKLAAAAVLGSVLAGGAGAATIESCGGKSFSATQGIVDLSVTDPGSMCGDQGGDLGNSTGKKSLISLAGWTSGAEVQGSNPEDSTNEGDGKLSLTIGDGAGNLNVWSILNPHGYSMLGLSIKHGNGYAFYALDADALLSGTWFTYEKVTAGNAFSHVNAWYKGDPSPSSPIPLPAAGWLLIGGLGGLGAIRRFKKS